MSLILVFLTAALRSSLQSGLSALNSRIIWNALVHGGLAMPQTCTYCQSSIDDGDAFCQVCGRPTASANGSDVIAENPEPVIAAVPAGVPTAGLPSWASPAGTGGLPSPVPARSRSSAAAAPGGANDVYMGRRLTYSAPPCMFSWADLAPQCSSSSSL